LQTGIGDNAVKRILSLATIVGFVAVVVVAASLPYTSRTSAQTSPTDPQYFPETGHTVRAPFVEYFSQTGGINQHGFPITDDYVDPQTGLLVQYFEKSRLEWHPGNPDPYKVQLGLLGDEMGKRAGPVDIAQIPAPNDPTCFYFSDTGHTLCHNFREYFLQNGGLDRFGFPISEYTIEGDRIVQYFQRARMEWHPEKPAGQRVQLGPLGSQQYRFAGLDTRRLSPGGYEPGSPGNVRSLVARGSVINSVAVSNGSQTTFVFVTDQLGNPIPNAAVTLVVHYAHGDEVFTLPPTTATGTTFRTFTVPSVKAGTIVSMDFILAYAGVFTQTRTSYMVWY
jgi:hypothetical protein